MALVEVAPFMPFGTPACEDRLQVEINKYSALKKVNLHPKHFNKNLACVMGKEGIKHWGNGESESWHPV